MKTVDNFEQIKKLLTFGNINSFYFVQILQRKKDHPGVVLGGSNNNSRLIKAYYINSVEKLDVHKEEMIKLCQIFNARASINLNPRNYEKVAFRLLQKVADQMSNKDFYNVRTAYDSVCGLYSSEMDKRWLIDIDKDDVPELLRIQTTIQDLQESILNRDYCIQAVIPTVSGYHIITNPFNLDKFSKVWPKIEIHKNNPTLLYYEKHDNT
jgi:hypothetical protein